MKNKKKNKTDIVLVRYSVNVVTREQIANWGKVAEACVGLGEWRPNYKEWNLL